MTKEQFAQWFAYHSAAFTGIAAWLEKVTKGPESPPRIQVLRAWLRTLEDCDLAEAKAATDAMARGEIEEPKGFDRHPAAIRAACGKSRRQRAKSYEIERYENGDPDRGARLYCCPLCQDTGAVLCWHQQNIRDVLDGTFAAKRERGKAFRLYEQAVPCDCEAGRDRFPKAPARFDPDRALPLHRLIDGRLVLGRIHETEEQERFLAWVHETYLPAARRRFDARLDLAAPPPETGERAMACGPGLF